MYGIKIIDSTLRDGEQSAGLALNEKEKLDIARILDDMGIYQIEAGIPAMGGSEKRSICRIAEAGFKARVSTWNRIVVSDIKEAMSCGPVIIHISVPSSDLQIKRKLNKDRKWVYDNMIRCINTAREKNFEVTVGLEDASRADFLYLTLLSEKAASEGASMVRYADTVGILSRMKVMDDIGFLKKHISCEIGIHTHNDLGMAVANAISAVEAGASFVDTTIGGIGERAGNCDFIQFVQAARECFPSFNHMDIDRLTVAEQQILNKITRSRSA